MTRTPSRGSRPRPTRRRGRGTVGLDRALSKLGLASRADAKRLIAEGRVRVEGEVVLNPAMRIVPERARLSIDEDEAPTGRPPRRIVLFHKPRGTVTTRRDPEGRPTVFDVLGDTGRGLIAVGRLDRASTGLLIFTNDTHLANALTDPAHHVRRRYIVTVRGRVTPETARRLEQGLEVQVEPHVAPELLAAARVEIRKASGRETHLLVELDEGRNREIRRLFQAAGHEATRVHRVSFGPYELGNLQPGQWRERDG
jgi:23S rRNA pseudouridine2605 synthase